MIGREEIETLLPAYRLKERRSDLSSESRLPPVDGLVVMRLETSQDL